VTGLLFLREKREGGETQRGRNREITEYLSSLIPGEKGREGTGIRCLRGGKKRITACLSSFNRQQRGPHKLSTRGRGKKGDLPYHQKGGKGEKGSFPQSGALREETHSMVMTQPGDKGIRGRGKHLLFNFSRQGGREKGKKRSRRFTGMG